MKIARVFPTKTSMSPIDKDSYFDYPDMFTPKDYDEVHVSVTFTWDIKKGYELKKQWGTVCKNVIIGGVAINGECKNSFVSGMYLKKGITITSRGCPNNCNYCIIKNSLIEFDNFPEGNIIQDNNILACSNKHIEQVFKMLKHQKQIEFKGLESRRITVELADKLYLLNIKSLWLACDHDSDIKSLKKAVDILKNAGFKESHLYCYVLIGKEELRLRAVREMGVMPFAQLYLENKETKTIYTREMKHYQRLMSRPAVTRGIFKNDQNQNI